MAKLEKLIKRIKSFPVDFTWEELVRLLKQLGFVEIQGGGSRMKFFNAERNLLIHLHKPHPANTLKYYVMKEIVSQLTSEKLI